MLIGKIQDKKVIYILFAIFLFTLITPYRLNNFIQSHSLVRKQLVTTPIDMNYNQPTKESIKTSKLVVLHEVVVNIVEDITDKLHQNYLLSISRNKWSNGLFLIYILHVICILLIFIKTWILQISQGRYRLILVHLIQLKDGKKDAQILLNSF